MGKVLKPILLVAAVAVNVIPGVGQALSTAAFAALGTGFVSVGLAAAVSAGLAAAVGAGLAAAGGAFKTGRANAGLTSFDPKAINADPTAKRKMVFGRTAFPLDLRYGEPSGTNQEYIDYVFALAAHRSDGIEEIWIEDKQAWTLAGGAVGIYAGYLTVEIILEGGAGAYHTVNAGATWGSAQRMTGCTTMKVRVKRSNTTGSTSPFANGIAGRWTVIGRGMPLYDPALDSTVAGGSGSQRANDCTTWRWSVSSVERGRNPALQLLAYLLGYRINGIVSVGLGMPPALIDLASFATAAARCDEAVALAAGGSHRRYEAGRYFADDDDPDAVMAVLLGAMNAELTDDGGRLGLRVAVNDLTAAVTLTDDDIQNSFAWVPAPPPAEQFTLVRGRFQQPNAPSLFGLADYPDVTIPRTTPAPRPLVLDLSAVQDVRRAERIAKQVGQRSLYVGTFTARIGIRGWLLRRNMVVAWTSQARGWSGKLFRVRSLRFNVDGTVDCVVREENAAVYQWDAAETGNVSPVTPTTYDPRNAAWISAVAAAATTAIWSSVIDDGRKPVDNATRDRTGNVLDAAAAANEAAGWFTSGGATTIANSTIGGFGAFINARMVQIDLTSAFDAYNSTMMPIGGTGRQYASIRYTHNGTGSVALPGAVIFYDAAGTFISQTTFALPRVTAGVYSIATVSGAVPTGAAFWRLRFNAASALDAGATWRLDNIVALHNQPGADVTAQNTAADTANVNGTPAATLVSTATTAASNASTALTNAATANGNATTALTNAATAQATADAALALGLAAVPPRAITALGASAALDIVIPNGESRNFQTIVYFNLTSGTRTLTAPMEYRIGTGSWTPFGSTNSDTDTATSTLTVQNTGNIANSSGFAQNYQVRAVVAVTGGTGGTVDPALSYIGPY